MFENGEQVSQSVYWPVVRTVMEDEEFRNSRREKYCLALPHDEGPYLMDQIRGTRKANLELVVNDIVRSGDRITGKFIVKNTSDIPAFMVHIVVDNDCLVQCLGDDYFFMEADSAREICFTIRNDSRSDEALQITLNALNADTLNLTV